MDIFVKLLKTPHFIFAVFILIIGGLMYLYGMKGVIAGVAIGSIFVTTSELIEEGIKRNQDENDSKIVAIHLSLTLLGCLSVFL